MAIRRAAAGAWAARLHPGPRGTAMARPPKRPRIASVDDWRAGSGSEPDFVTALARGLDVLRAFGPDDDMLGSGDIAVRTAIPASTGSRLTRPPTGHASRREREGQDRWI